MRIRNKKGQAEYVAYILLIGLGVALAVIVGRWSIEQAQKTSERVVKQSSIEEKCNEIAIGGFVDKTGCSNNPQIKPNKINITNRGNLNIKKLRFDCGTGVSIPDEDVNLKPGKSITKTLNSCDTSIILPLTEVLDGETVGCSEKKLVLKLLC